MSHNPKESSFTWIVMLRLPMDDVLKGAYPSEADARTRMTEVLVDEMLSELDDALRPIGVTLYRVIGENVEMIDQVEFADAA